MPQNPSSHSGNLYEFPLLRRITGDTLRPGGLKVTDKAVKLCEFSVGDTLLDVGCGVGASVAFLQEQGFKAIGMDSSLTLLHEAHSHGPAVAGDAQALPFASDSFQGILCECVVSLLPQAEVFFQEARRVLVDGGWLVISDIVRMPIVSAAPPASCSSGHGGSDSGRQSRSLHSLAYAFSSNLLSPDSPLQQTTSLPQISLSRTPLLKPQDKSCLEGAKSRLEVERLYTQHGFSVRHVIDYRRSLVELAAKMVWEFGSMAAFWELWRKDTDAECHGMPAAKQFGYELFIGQKI